MGTQYRISKELVLNEQSGLAQLAVYVEPAPPPYAIRGPDGP